MLGPGGSIVVTSVGRPVLPATGTETAPSLVWFATIHCIESKQDLAGLAPKDCFIPAKPVERGTDGAIAGNWTCRVEYLYIDRGNVNFAFATMPGRFGTATACGPVVAGTGGISSHVTDDMVRVGFNYRFSPL